MRVCYVFVVLLGILLNVYIVCMIVGFVVSLFWFCCVILGKSFDFFDFCFICNWSCEEFLFFSVLGVKGFCEFRRN